MDDFAIKHVNRREVSRVNSLKTRSHIGAITEDVIDYIKPTTCKKTDMFIIHTGANDISNKVNKF